MIDTDSMWGREVICFLTYITQISRTDVFHSLGFGPLGPRGAAAGSIVFARANAHARGPHSGRARVASAPPALAYLPYVGGGLLSSFNSFGSSWR